MGTAGVQPDGPRGMLRIAQISKLSTWELPAGRNNAGGAVLRRAARHLRNLDEQGGASTRSGPSGPGGCGVHYGAAYVPSGGEKGRAVQERTIAST